MAIRDLYEIKDAPLAERAARALQELSNAAVENGTSEMSLEEINAEIEAVRNVECQVKLTHFFV